MPIKNQMDCYRTFNGVRWPNFCDMLDNHLMMKVAEAISAGKRIKVRKHPNGYGQAFIHPDDLPAA